MKITTFNPQIITKNPEKMLQLFEEIGFRIKHNKKELEEYGLTAYRLEDENENCLDISATETDLHGRESMLAIRMNVTNIATAYSFLKAKGFENIYGNHLLETPTSKSAVLINKDGLAINLIEHIRKED